MHDPVPEILKRYNSLFANGFNQKINAALFSVDLPLPKDRFQGTCH